jgi:hypothetical protein
MFLGLLLIIAAKMDKEKKRGWSEREREREIKTEKEMAKGSSQEKKDSQKARQPAQSPEPGH